MAGASNLFASEERDVTTQENKALYRRFFEGVMNRKDTALLDELLAACNAAIDQNRQFT